MAGSSAALLLVALTRLLKDKILGAWEAIDLATFGKSLATPVRDHQNFKELASAFTP